MNWLFCLFWGACGCHSRYLGYGNRLFFKERPYATNWFQKSKKGESGAIFLIGTIGTIAGGLGIALISQTVHDSKLAIFFITAAGIMGSFVDSFLDNSFKPNTSAIYLVKL